MTTTCARCGEAIAIDPDSPEEQIWTSEATGLVICHDYTGHDTAGTFGPAHEPVAAEVLRHDDEYSVHHDSNASGCPSCVALVEWNKTHPAPPEPIRIALDADFDQRWLDLDLGEGRARFQVCVTRTDEGVMVDVYGVDDDGGNIDVDASTYAFDNDVKDAKEA